MKYCIHCGAQIFDDAEICVHCGQNVPVLKRKVGKKFCSDCGRELLSEAIICPYCGCSTSKRNINNSHNPTNTDDYLIKTLSERFKINGIIWIVLAVLQLLIFTFDISMWYIGIVGIINMVSAITDLRFSKKILYNPEGIVKTCKPLTGPIIALVYN